MADSSVNQTLHLNTTLTSVGSDGDNDASTVPSNVPDYGMKLVDVVLNSNQLIVELDSSGGQHPPTVDAPYQSLEVAFIMQHQPDGDRILLSQKTEDNFSTAKFNAKVDLTANLVEPGQKYSIEVKVSGINHDGDVIQFNSVDGQTEFVESKTVDCN